MKHPYTITAIRELDWVPTTGQWLAEHKVDGAVIVFSDARLYYSPRFFTTPYLYKDIKKFPFRIKLVLDVSCEGKPYRIVVTTPVTTTQGLPTDEYTQNNNEFIGMLLHEIIKDKGEQTNVQDSHTSN